VAMRAGKLRHNSTTPLFYVGNHVPVATLETTIPLRHHHR